MHEDETLLKVSKYFKLLGDYNRLAILFLLKTDKRSVTEIYQALNMEQSAVSHQLKVLRQAHLVKAQRQGKSMIYELDDHHVLDILEQMWRHASEHEDDKDKEMDND